MEINNINSSSINELNPLTNSVNTKNVNATQVNEYLNDSSSYFINPDISPKRSNLSQNLNQYITSISQTQIDISALNTKNNILNNISNLTNEIQIPQNTQEITQNLQIDISQLISQYNSVPQSSNSVNESNAYFDGKLGATPLNISEIVRATEEQQVIVKQSLHNHSQKIEAIKTKAIDTISNEVAKETPKIFKNIDFGKNTSDFTSSTINNIVGSVALSQANAIPSNSARLLS